VDTQRDLRTKAVAAFVMSGICLAATPFLAVVQLPPTQHGGKSNAVVTAAAAGLSLLGLVIGLVDRRMACSAPLARPTRTDEQQASARRDVWLLMGGQAVLMTVVGVVLLLGHHIPMAILSFLAATIFVSVAALGRKSQSTVGAIG
jgi:Flp pilus assembly protein TadB